MTIRQSIHNKMRLLALLQHRHTGFQHQLPMVSNLTITRPKLGHSKHKDQQSAAPTLLCEDTLCAPETTFDILLTRLHPSIPAETISNIQVLRGRAAMIVSGLPRSVLQNAWPVLSRMSQDSSRFVMPFFL